MCLNKEKSQSAWSLELSSCTKIIEIPFVLHQSLRSGVEGFQADFFYWQKLGSDIFPNHLILMI